MRFDPRFLFKKEYTVQGLVSPAMLEKAEGCFRNCRLLCFAAINSVSIFAL